MKEKANLEERYSINRPVPNRRREEEERNKEGEGLTSSIVKKHRNVCRSIKRKHYGREGNVKNVQ